MDFQIWSQCLFSTYGEVCDFKEEGKESNNEQNQLLEEYPVDMVLNVPEKNVLHLQLTMCQPSEDNFNFGLTHLSRIVNK